MDEFDLEPDFDPPPPLPDLPSPPSADNALLTLRQGDEVWIRSRELVWARAHIVDLSSSSASDPTSGDPMTVEVTDPPKKRGATPTTTAFKVPSDACPVFFRCNKFGKVLFYDDYTPLDAIFAHTEKMNK